MPAGERISGEFLPALLPDATVILSAAPIENGRLDTKIRMLNQLLLECDQKKRELEDLLARAGGPAAAPADPAPAPAARPSNPLHTQVYSLQDSGKEILDICAATGLEKGEVELILGLRKMPREKA